MAIKKQLKTYISLFSSAGVGCYGFKLNGFDCIATNELIERRLNIQKFNNKCSMDSGYILGDITAPGIKQSLLAQIKKYKTLHNIQEVDVIIATPPCQGMSVANHKKTNIEIKRNSLVVEAINLIKDINPKFFVFDIIDLNTNERLGYEDICKYVKILGLDMVPVEEVGNSFNYTLDELLVMADGKYDSGLPKEGIVIRPLIPEYNMDVGSKLSFKVLNNKFLLKE